MKVESMKSISLSPLKAVCGAGSWLQAAAGYKLQLVAAGCADKASEAGECGGSAQVSMAFNHCSPPVSRWYLYIIIATPSSHQQPGYNKQSQLIHRRSSLTT